MSTLAQVEAVDPTHASLSYVPSSAADAVIPFTPARIVPVAARFVPIPQEWHRVDPSWS
jgi:hypothetical protein